MCKGFVCNGTLWPGKPPAKPVRPMQRDVRLVEITDEELDMLHKVDVTAAFGGPVDFHKDPLPFSCCTFSRLLHKIEDTPVMKCSDVKSAIPRCVFCDVSLLPWNGGIGMEGAYMKTVETFIGATESGEPLQHYAKIYICGKCMQVTIDYPKLKAYINAEVGGVDTTLSPWTQPVQRGDSI